MSKTNSKRRQAKLNLEDIREVRKNVKTVEIISYGTAVEKFIRSCENKNLSENTVKYYRRELDLFGRHLVDYADVNLDDVSRIAEDHIYETIRALKDRGRSDNTINTRLRAVRSFFNFLTKRGMVDKSPMEDVSLLKTKQEVGDTFSQTQLKRILDAPDVETFTGLRDYALMRTFADTGCRLRELTSLTVQCLDFEESVVEFRVTKNGKMRRVPMSKVLKRTLKTWLKVRGMELETNALFITEMDTALTGRQVQNRIKYYGKVTRLENEVTCSPHVFRRTFAKRLIQKGVDVFTAQALLGHSSLEILKQYVALYSEDLRRGIDKAF